MLNNVKISSFEKLCSKQKKRHLDIEILQQQSKILQHCKISYWLFSEEEERWLIP